MITKFFFRVRIWILWVKLTDYEHERQSRSFQNNLNLRQRAPYSRVSCRNIIGMSWSHCVKHKKLSEGWKFSGLIAMRELETIIDDDYWDECHQNNKFVTSHRTCEGSILRRYENASTIFVFCNIFWESVNEEPVYISLRILATLKNETMCSLYM